MRVVQAWGLDLSIFQFDYELTWAVVFLNADGTVYGRYGTRTTHKDAGRDVSLDGFKEACRGALELHREYPGNRGELERKKGPRPPWPVPEAIPALKGRPNVRPADGSRGRCVHCHQAHDGHIWSLREARQRIPDHLVRPYPMPDLLGLVMDPATRATVRSVTPGSPAARAKFWEGDRILRLDGQAIISIADVQWFLHHADVRMAIPAEVARKDERLDLSLDLPEGWRDRVDFTWRTFTWSTRHRLLGTQPLEFVAADERKRLGVPDGQMALRIPGLPPDWVRDRNPSARGFRAGDVIVQADGRRDLATESALLAYLLQQKAPGSAVEIEVLRDGRIHRIGLKMP